MAAVIVLEKKLRFFFFLYGCLTPRGPTTIYHQRPYQLGTHRLPEAGTIPAESRLTAETEDVHKGTAPIMEHQAIF